MVTMRAYRKPPSLFRMVRSMTYMILSLEMGILSAPLVNVVILCLILNGHISRSGWSDPLHVSFYDRVFGVGGSNGAISGSIKSRIAADRHLGKLQRHRAVSLRQHGFLVLDAGAFVFTKHPFLIIRLYNFVYWIAYVLMLYFFSSLCVVTTAVEQRDWLPIENTVASVLLSSRLAPGLHPPPPSPLPLSLDSAGDVNTVVDEKIWYTVENPSAVLADKKVPSA